MFVIARHGNTFEAGELPRRIGSRTNLPLTVTGLAQARALGRHFAVEGHCFTRLLVSPLLRTRQTAEAVLEELSPHPTVEICEWLREIDHGPDENMPEDAVRARVGRTALKAWDARAKPVPGWSVDAEMRIAGWLALFGAPQDNSTLVITSNGAARFALLADPALAAASARLASLKLPTGGYGVILRDANGLLDVPVWGRRP